MTYPSVLEVSEIAVRKADSLAIVVTSVASDAHTWNLVYLQLVLEELGHQVTNLGCCVVPSLLLSECLRSAPDLVVVSSVNGHGQVDGAQSVRRLREQEELAGLPVVIGGQLGIAGPGQDRREELLCAGFDAVFEGNAGMPAFFGFLQTLRPGLVRTEALARYRH